MSFATTRVSLFAFLIGVPLVHAVGCGAPNRHYEPDLEGGTQGLGGTGHNGGTGASSTAGKGGAGTSGSNGTAGDGAGTGPGAGEGGEAGATGGTTTGGKTNGGSTGTGGSVVGQGGASVGGGEGTAGEAGAGGETGAAGSAGAGTGGVGTGGIGNTGGTGGTLSGGTGGILGTGGLLTGGKGGSGGTTGGVTSGGATSGGKGGSGGTGGTGTCTPKAEVCNNNLDDDCDGHVDDCLTVTNTFPDMNGAAAGKDVLIQVAALSGTGWRFQCRSSRGTSVLTTAVWADCPTGSNTRILPRTTTESAAAANDGLWSTQVRAIWTDNATTDPVSLTYYMHSSMHNAPRCNPLATDLQYFTAAKAYISDQGALGNTTVLRAPFIQLGFTPPVSTYFNVTTGQGTVKVMSLRHRFVRSADDRYILMTRNYVSSRGGGCKAISLSTHSTELPTIDRGRFYEDDCDALVFNKVGTGTCLVSNGTSAMPQRSTHKNPYTRTAPYSPSADNFAWRKLDDKRLQSDGFIHFMPKCTTSGCASGWTIFLPDRTTYFSYF